MRLLNLGCGPCRPGEPWVNVDMFHSMFEMGTPERAQIDACQNYVNADLTKKLPFEDGSFEGAALLHVLEHFNAQDGLRLLQEAHRVLKPGGVVLVSVPDASYFRKVYPEDRNENWPRLFETTDPKNPIPTFFEAALWFGEHQAILTADALWCYLMRAGFEPWQINPEYTALVGQSDNGGVVDEMSKQLNRRIFSVEMVGVKQ